MPPKAFVSSTYEDLKEHRAFVIEALRKAGFQVDPMEDWTSSKDEPKRFSTERVGGCDLCVLLVALRRGHVPSGETRSITQLEYAHALQEGIDTLPFLLEEEAPWSRNFDDLDHDPEVRTWRQQISERHGVGFFDQRPSSIEIAPALIRWLAAHQGDEATRTKVPFSTVPPRRSRPFIGRAREEAQIRDCFDDEDRGVRVLVVHGQSGVGKTELSFQYARHGLERYPGGTFFVRMGSAGPPADLAAIGTRFLRLKELDQLALEDQCQTTLARLGQERTLLLYDAVASPSQLERWLPGAGRRVDVLATSIWSDWDLSWDTVEIPPLPDEQGHELVVELAGPVIAGKFGSELVAEANGLPVQLCPAVIALARSVRRHRRKQIGPKLMRQTLGSFERAWSALPEDGKLVAQVAALFESERIPRELLLSRLAEGTEWSPAVVQGALDDCMNLHLLEGEQKLRMHGLVADFVRGRLKEGNDPPIPAELLANHAREFAALCAETAENPADPERVELLSAFPASLGTWAGLPSDLLGVLSEEDQHWIGEALFETGRYEEAQGWYELAVKEKEQGDVHGRVDHESLGRSVHQVGLCLSSLGRYEEARGWYERAVKEKEQGGADGRVDHVSLGKSVHQVGLCLSPLGRYEEAQGWYERAVKEKEQGDVHGRVDLDSLGASVHQVGLCLSSLGRYEEAQGWYERAVKEAEQGDVHGRVDHESLGASVHQVGLCLSSLGRYEEAQGWYERAVNEAEQGDVHGRVDHVSLGKSVHQVGLCLSSLGRHEEAQGWYERAVKEKEQGDVHGRVDHESLGKSVHQMGLCLSSLGRYEEAQGWYERAVEEAEQGDVHGRVDHVSLERTLRSGAQNLRSLERPEEAAQWEETAKASLSKRESQ